MLRSFAMHHLCSAQRTMLDNSNYIMHFIIFKHNNSKNQDAKHIMHENIEKNINDPLFVL
jgi:hypothetical protein